MKAFALLVLSVATVAPSIARGDDALFVRRVWPLFQEKCLACHGKDPAKLKGGYDLRTSEAAVRGGDSGEPAIHPREAEHSPLYLAITRQHEPDWEPMPPKENDRLTETQIGWVREWITAGAPWPDEKQATAIASANAAAWSAEDGITVRTSGGLAPEWTNRRYKPDALWAYQPVRAPEAAGVDALLAARMPTGLAPAPAADRRTLIRRASFDLLGLPPAAEEVAAFLRDPDPDEPAFARVVERLLASPHYGEQQAQRWLDVVRYADTGGFANDYARGNAWRYRDYVVRAFNADRPYDRFIREQIAGDELEPENPEALVATGFLRMGPWELTGMEVAKVARQRFLDDVTQTVGETFLGQALQCARCHDHKFDPVPTRDYYAIQAVFGTTQLAERPAAFLPEENIRGFEEQRYLEQRREFYLATLQRLDAKSLAAADEWFRAHPAEQARWNEAVAAVRGGAVPKGRRASVSVFDAVRARLQQAGVAEASYPPKQLGFVTEDFGLERIARKGLERLAWDFDRYEPVALSVYSGRTPELKSVYAPLRMPPNRKTAGELEETCILTGGDPFASGAKVVPAVLSAATAFAEPASPLPEIPAALEGRRAVLARWIASPANPLTARVMVNRLWLGHFGQAIAGNPNNFGGTGKRPTHPELLDWLAARFVASGWSVKAMHRLIMNSAAYRRASAHPDPAQLASSDPEGTSYAVFRPRRLTAEELRDAMLGTSGELNPELGGIPVRPEINREAALQPRQVMGTFAEAWQPSPLPAQRHRRSLYALKVRGQADPFSDVFNAPSPDLSCERREASTVTPQVFALFNSQATYDRALAFAARVWRKEAAAGEAVRAVFQRAFNREPSASELAIALRHWEAMTARHRTLTMPRVEVPREVVRDAVEENTGERFQFREPLEAAADFIPDLQATDAAPELRGLAELCLVIFNSNEFVYLY